MNFAQPSSKAGLVAAFDRLGGDGLQFWSDFSPDGFFESVGRGWSPAENVLHLTKSTKPVGLALRLPRLLLRLLFGVSSQPSKTEADVCDQNKAALAAGGQARRFAPAPVGKPENPAEQKAAFLRQLQQEIAALRHTVDKWSEADLDRCRLPHPLLGKLTIREMLLFTLIHFAHHEQSVRTRLASPARP